MTPTRLMNRRGQYRIRNAATSKDVTEILLYDEIGEDLWFGGGVSAKQFAEDLNAIDTPEIHLRINSPGGDVFEAVAMLNSLRRHDAHTIVYIDGLAASAASVVAMGGDELVMARNSEMMIHDAWGVAIGNSTVMDKMSDDLSRISNNLASAYADKAGGSVADWREAMKAETWYSDKEAVKAGLADRAEQAQTASDKAKAKFNLGLYAYAGRAEAPAPYLPAEPDDHTPKEGSVMPDTLALVRQRLGLSADADEASILAALPDNSDDDTQELDAVSNDPDDDEDDEIEGVPDAGDPTSDPKLETISAEVLAELRRDAEAGRRAFEAQQAQHRETIVNEAVREGRISPARKKDWLAKLTKDPGSETELASLAKGLIPVDGPKGYTGSLSDVSESDDEAVYNALFPKGA